MRAWNFPRGLGRVGIVELAVLFCLAGMVAGCGSEPPIPLYPAYGQVLIGGKPEAGVEIRLHPADKLEDVDAPRPFGTTDAEGKFDLGTFEAGDGAPTGRYVVTFFWPGEARGPAPPPDKLAGTYTNLKESKFEASIGEKSTELPPFELAPPKTTSNRNAAKNRSAARRQQAQPPGPEGFGAPPATP